jgi:hypothetical protein
LLTGGCSYLKVGTVTKGNSPFVAIASRDGVKLRIVVNKLILWTSAASPIVLEGIVAIFGVRSSSPLRKM